MSEVKVYRIKGLIKKPGSRMPFTREYSAVKREDALRRVYSEMGSRHKARRFEIEILSVEESTREEEATAES